MTCLRLPLSLNDANAIIAACTGQPDWRASFLLGLGAVAFFGLLAAIVVLGLRARP